MAIILRILVSGSRSWWEQLAIKDAVDWQLLMYWTELFYGRTALKVSFCSSAQLPPEVCRMGFCHFLPWLSLCCLTSSRHKSSTGALSSCWIAPKWGEMFGFSSDPPVYSKLILWLCSCSSAIFLLITHSYSLQVRPGISIQSDAKYGGLVSLANRNVESFHYSWLFTAVAHKLKHSGWSEAAGLSSSETSQFRLQGQIDRGWIFFLKGGGNLEGHLRNRWVNEIQGDQIFHHMFMK